MDQNRRPENGSVLVAVVDPSRESVDGDASAGPDWSESEDGPRVVSFADVEGLWRTFTPTALELLETVRRERPASINETARVAGRDVKNVHDELKRLARSGVIRFSEEGRAKRPVVPFDELVVDLPLVEDVPPGGVGDVPGLRRPEGDLETVYGRLSDAVLALDTDERVTYLNDRAEELLDRSRDQLLGEVIWDQFPVAVGTTFESEYRRAIESQESVRFEEHFSPLETWFVVRIYPSETGVSAHFRDVTERKRREKRLDFQREQLASINRLNRAIREITHAAIGASSQGEIERQVCDRLVEMGIYALVWTGRVDRGGRTVTPSRTAGDDEGYLDGIGIAVGSADPLGQGPTGVAVRTHEPQFVRDVREDAAYGPWRTRALNRGFRSTAAIPIRHEGVLYGVLNVYATRTDAFTTVERETLTHLGEVVGHAIHAIEQRKVLAGDAVLELEFRNEAIARTFTAGLDADDGGPVEISIERTVAADEGSALQFVTVSGMSAEQYEAALRRFPSTDRVRHVAGDADDELLFEIRERGPSISATIASYGGRITGWTITPDELRLFAELPPEVDTRAVTEAIGEVYPGTELLAQRTKAREEVTLHTLDGALTDRLTDRQRTALAAAYVAGYFEWPRTTTGEEVAEMLDVSPPTFAQHLRTAERKLFAALYDAD
ncbi:bacterio-opsin activator domain-containing protein [Halalkalicoccus sp. NIPERK01]|uniref:bacterio-opsin activator domain-containing protein n=1 Tax=Halalkalicoccus sp. NIPERK01 TaxID=3053469 RepID=UPI00256EAE00|nr:bacterio-opsin activator domain-containing protein [Halalkalicoccus sp. NIPERK01]MDL5361024.1 bacterio-opsin activator domain-containing protein [Halalkalicoccus sp. NIPERK01]